MSQERGEHPPGAPAPPRTRTRPCPTLADKASAAWARYESACRTGTPEQRQWACDQAVKADDALGQYDLRNQSKTDTQELDAVA